MTTPAVNISISDSKTETYDWFLPDGRKETKSAPPVYTRNERRARPESGSSPLRVDGTRGPRGWNHSWLMLQNPYCTFDCSSSQGIRAMGSIPGVLQNSGNNSVTLIPGKNLWLDPTNPAIFPLLVESEAKVRLYNKVLKGRTEDGGVNLGESLAELRETIGFVKSLATRTGKALSDLEGANRTLMDSLFGNEAKLRAQGRRVVRFLKRFDNMPVKEAVSRARDYAGKRGAGVVSDWLGYQFGLRPLLGDIEFSSKELSRLVLRDRAENGYTMVCRAGAQRIEDLETEAPCSFFGVKLRMRHSVLTRVHYSVRVGYPIPSAARYEALGLSNPYSTLYNVTRLSWLVDYAVGIGDWLESLTPALNGFVNQQFIEGSCSRIQSGYLDSLEGIAVAPWTVRKFHVPELRQAAGRFERTVLSSWPIPPVLPPIRRSIGLKQMANAVSALAVLAGKR